MLFKVGESVDSTVSQTPFLVKRNIAGGSEWEPYSMGQGKGSLIAQGWGWYCPPHSTHLYSFSSEYQPWVEPVSALKSARRDQSRSKSGASSHRPHLYQNWNPGVSGSLLGLPDLANWRTLLSLLTAKIPGSWALLSTEFSAGILEMTLPTLDF